jgi:hypothetical protein
MAERSSIGLPSNTKGNLLYEIGLCTGKNIGSGYELNRFQTVDTEGEHPIWKL